MSKLINIEQYDNLVKLVINELRSNVFDDRLLFKIKDNKSKYLEKFRSSTQDLKVSLLGFRSCMGDIEKTKSRLDILVNEVVDMMYFKEACSSLNELDSKASCAFNFITQVILSVIIDNSNNSIDEVSQLLLLKCRERSALYDKLI